MEVKAPKVETKVETKENGTYGKDIKIAKLESELDALKAKSKFEVEVMSALTVMFVIITALVVGILTHWITAASLTETKPKYGLTDWEMVTQCVQDNGYPADCLNKLK